MNLQTHATQGQLDGLTDARRGITFWHSQTAYKFPRDASYPEQAAYNENYSESQRMYYEARERERDQEQCQHPNADDYFTTCPDCKATLPEVREISPNVIEVTKGE